MPAITLNLEDGQIVINTDAILSARTYTDDVMRCEVVMTQRILLVTTEDYVRIRNLMHRHIVEVDECDDIGQVNELLEDGNWSILDTHLNPENPEDIIYVMGRWSA